MLRKLARLQPCPSCDRSLERRQRLHKTLLSQWIEDWKDGYLIGIKESSKKNYLYHMNSHVIPALGNKKIQSIEQRDIQKFCTMLFTKKELSPKTVKNIHWTLHKCFDDALKAGLINSNPS
ncbi:hypothetical protein GH811_00005, partial [Acetobacterium malicum]